MWHWSLIWLLLSVSLNCLPLIENAIAVFFFCYLLYLWHSPIHCSRSLPKYDDFRCWETWIWEGLLSDIQLSEACQVHKCPVWMFPISDLRLERLGYVCNPRSLKEGTETSRRRTDELGYRLERPIHFECKLNEPMHIGMRLLHPAAADNSVSINRQQVQRIFRFSLRSRAGARPLSGGTGAVATWRDVSVPSFRERGLHT